MTLLQRTENDVENDCAGRGVWHTPKQLSWAYAIRPYTRFISMGCMIASLVGTKQSIRIIVATMSLTIKNYAVSDIATLVLGVALTKIRGYCTLYNKVFRY
jgi:hypothetical protein